MEYVYIPLSIANLNDVLSAMAKKGWRVHTLNHNDNGGDTVHVLMERPASGYIRD